MRNILLIILILLLIGAFPGWGYSSGWGYYPFGGIGLLLLIVLILALTGRLSKRSVATSRHELRETNVLSSAGRRILGS